MKMLVLALLAMLMMAPSIRADLVSETIQMAKQEAAKCSHKSQTLPPLRAGKEAFFTKHKDGITAREKIRLFSSGIISKATLPWPDYDAKITILKSDYLREMTIQVAGSAGDIAAPPSESARYCPLNAAVTLAREDRCDFWINGARISVDWDLESKEDTASAYLGLALFKSPNKPKSLIEKRFFGLGPSLSLTAGKEIDFSGIKVRFLGYENKEWKLNVQASFDQPPLRGIGCSAGGVIGLKYPDRCHFQLASGRWISFDWEYDGAAEQWVLATAEKKEN